MATLTRFAQAFRTPDLRKKMLFTLALIALFRFGSALPAPGISAANVRYCAGLESSRGAAANLYAILNIFSGNSLLHVTVFALGIMPYITASIIVQLMTQVIPRLQALKDQDRAGQATLTQYTRYLTLGLAVITSAGYVELARSGNLFPGTDCSAVSHPLVPDPSVLTIATMMITMVAGTAVPVIFASSLLTIPQLAASLLGNQDNPQGWVAWVDRYLVPGAHVLPVYYLAFFVLIIAFTFFYVSITFNPAEVADNTRKYGGFVPGLRPGSPTADYLGYVLARLTTPGAVYLAVIALLPMVALGMIGIGSQALFSGVSLLIMVGVGLDTVKQVESQLQQHHYEGFLHRSATPAGKVTGTSEAPAALTVS